MAEFRYGNSALCCVLWKSFFEGIGGAEGELDWWLLEDLLLLRHHHFNRWGSAESVNGLSGLTSTSPHQSNTWNQFLIQLIQFILFLDTNEAITGTLFLMQPDEDRSKLKLQNDDFHVTSSFSRSWLSDLLFSTRQKSSASKPQELSSEICGRSPFPPSGVSKIPPVAVSLPQVRTLEVVSTRLACSGSRQEQHEAASWFDLFLSEESGPWNQLY